jgi:hypothetical protein
LEGNGLGLLRYYLGICVEGLRKTPNTVRIAGVPNTSLEGYRETSLLGHHLFKGDIFLY